MGRYSSRAAAHGFTGLGLRPHSRIQGSTVKDGTHHDKVKVTPINANRSQLVAVADTSGDEKADESSALRIVRILCDKMGLKYKLIKG